MYLLPVSQTNATTRFGLVCSRQYFSAAARIVPLDEPPRMPSDLSKSRPAWKLSRSLIEYDFVTRVKSEMLGRKSSPMPSTIHEPDLVDSTPSLTYCVRIEPTGSAMISSTFGAACAK